MRELSGSGGRAAASMPALWDQRLARHLARALARTPVTPNQVTAVGLVSGLTAGWCYAQGGSAAYWGAGLYVFAAWIDHADGELARLTGRSSRFGLYFDNLAGGINFLALFAGMGWGLREAGGFWTPGPWAAYLGAATALAVAAIAVFRARLEDRGGRAAVAQPGAFGFEIEDTMYLIAPITWLGWHGYFLTLAGIGAPLFLLWQLWRARPLRGPAR